MRRNVRRLNREVGGVVVTMPSAKKKATDGEDSKKGGRNNNTKKAANLSELKRYCKAAEEAAREVLMESQGMESLPTYHPVCDDLSAQVQSLANLEDTLPLKSPSRMVALQLANGNPAFREKLKRKLEESGVTFEMDAAAGVFAGFGDSGSGSKKGKNGKPPLSGEGDSRRSKKRKAGDDGKASIIRRRRKQELNIGVQGTAAPIHPGPMMVSTGGTPFRVSLGGISPFNVDKHVNFGEEVYGGGLGSLGGLIGLPMSSETPSRFSFDNKDASHLNVTPRFDFDEVTQHFPSPRAGEKLGSSPNRWSTGSLNSFMFPDSAKGKDKESKERDAVHSSQKENMRQKIRLSTSSRNSDISGNDNIHLDYSAVDNLALPSPMSALPSPSMADISASFFNSTTSSLNDSLTSDPNSDTNVVSSESGESVN